MRQRRAFSLIELLVVIALAAFMAGIVVVSLSGAFRAARAKDVAGRIETFDRLTRASCRNAGRPGILRFDLERQTIARIEPDRSADENATLHLPSGIRLGAVATSAGRVTSGQVALPCSAAGHTPTYALQWTESDSTSHWSITLGLTGRSTMAQNDQEVQDIFRALGASAGDDAH